MSWSPSPPTWPSSPRPGPPSPPATPRPGAGRPPRRRPGRGCARAGRRPPEAGDLADALARVPPTDPGHRPGPEARWALVFTSGTSSDPKAVVCTPAPAPDHRQPHADAAGAGPRRRGLRVHAAVPLQRADGRVGAVAGGRVRSWRWPGASRPRGWLPDVRRYGATWFNYTGKPLSYLLATPEQPDDADNPVRVAFGNEGSPRVLDEFSRRFDVEVIDAFGSTEGAIAVEPRRRVPARGDGGRGRHGHGRGSVGPSVPTGRRCDAGRQRGQPRGVRGRDRQHRGRGALRGLLQQPRGHRAALRNGWYWSGDLGYLDEDRYLYFAGRTADWIRVDGENFPAGPVDEALAAASRRGRRRGLRGARRRTPATRSWPRWCWPRAAQLRPRGGSRPGWTGTRACPPSGGPGTCGSPTELPTTGTNKVVKRTLVHQKYRPDRCGSDELWERGRGDPAFRPFGPEQAQDDARRAGRSGTRTVLGPLMDLGFTPEEHGLRRRGPRLAGRAPGEVPQFADLDEEVEWGRPLAGPHGRGALGRDLLARGVRGPGGLAGAGGPVQPGVRTGRGTPTGESGGASTWRGRPCSPTAPRTRSSGGSRASSTRRRSGASCSPSPTPAATWPPCAPGPSRPPTTGAAPVGG